MTDAVSLAEALAPHRLRLGSCRCGVQIVGGLYDDHVLEAGYGLHLQDITLAWFAALLDESREDVADALGDHSKAVNVFDYTDEATTFITASVEEIADRTIAAIKQRAGMPS
jgi:hypothetical protein